MEKFTITQIFQQPQTRIVTMLTTTDQGQEVQLGPFRYPEVCDLMEGDIIELKDRDLYQLRLVGTVKK